MIISDFSIRRPVSISMIVLGVLLLGIVSVGGIPVNLLPDITFPRVTIRTEYPQAAPSEVENMVTKPIEQVVGVINRVVNISSLSKSGMSDVIVEFEWGADLDIATMEIREKLQILQFPDDVEKPVILRYDPAQDPIMTLGITGEMSPPDLRYFAENEVQLPLERLDGVAAVKVRGGYDEEIMVALDEGKTRRLGITVAQVIGRLENENINLSGGTLKDAGAELAVRTTNAFTSINDIRELVIVPEGVSAASAARESSSSSENVDTGAVERIASMFGMGMTPGASTGGFSGTVSTVGMGDTRPPKGAIRLKDIANVVRQPKRREEIARLDGKDCIQVSIYKEGDANVVSVCRALRRILQNVKASLKKTGDREPIPDWGEVWETFRSSPAKGLRLAGRKLRKNDDTGDEQLVNGIKIVTIEDQAVFIENAISAVYQTAMWGAVIAILVIYLFLRSARSTFIIALAIPTSIVATFNLMYFFDITWNVMSLGGLALGVGLLVDNAIVVLENIFRLREGEGGSATVTASDGVGQVSTAITASTLTNVAVFFPIVFVVGIAGQIFRDLALTVTFGLILSELTAFTIVPMLSVVLKPGMESSPSTAASDPGTVQDVKISGLSRWTAKFIRKCFTLSIGALDLAFKPLLAIFDSTFNVVKELHPRLLAKVLDRPGSVLVVSILISIASIFVVLILGFELLPPVDQGKFTIHMEMQTGTPIEETDGKVVGVENAFESIRDEVYLQNVFTSVGYGVGQAAGAEKKSENIAEMQITLARNRPLSDFKIMDRLRLALRKILAGAEIKMSRPTLLSYKTPVEIEIVGNNIGELKRLADLVAVKVSKIPGIHDVESTGHRSNPEIHVLVDRDRAAAMGLTPTQVTDELRKKVKGEVVTDLDEGEDQVDIAVQIREEDRSNLRRLGEISIARSSGSPVSLKVLAQLRTAQGPGVINRVGNSRVSLVTADLSGRPLGDAVRDIKKSLEAVRMPAGYVWRITGQNEEMRRSLISLAAATALAIALVYIVLSSLFESLVHPFVIMFTVPYALVGVAAMLLLTGTSLNVFSFIGIMMMVGIAVNDAIVYVEMVNYHRRAGNNRREALMSAGADRLRPILITTLTTVLGMVPMAVIGGEGAELRAPIAIAVIGGLTSATIFTLTCIPAVYTVLDKLRPGRGEKAPKTISDRME